MSVCLAPAQDGLVSALLYTVDCHVRVFVHDAYRDLVGPGTVFATALTGLLTVYIALLGYQLLIGRGGVRVTQLPLIALKIGIVLAFVTSWAAYQTVFFDLLFDGPRWITRVLLAPLARMGAGVDGDVYAGLEQAYGDLAMAATAYGAQAPPNANILQGGPMLGAGVLWLSGLAMLLCTAGVILAAKIILALLLALGPIFVAFYLFEPSRSLFHGWLRTTIGVALVPLSVNVFGAAMILMLAPFLARLRAHVWNNQFDMSLIITIALIVCVFGIVTAMAMRFGLAMINASPAGRESHVSERAEMPPSEYKRIDADAASPASPQPEAWQVTASPKLSSHWLREYNSAPVAVLAVPVPQRIGQAFRKKAQPRPRSAAPTHLTKFDKGDSH